MLKNTRFGEEAAGLEAGRSIRLQAWAQTGMVWIQGEEGIMGSSCANGLFAV